MTKFFITAAVLSLGAAAGFATAAQAADGPPMPWAWGVNTPPPAVLPPPAPPAAPVVPDNTKLLSLPGAKAQFTRAQVANRHAPADWYPEDHPAMPDIVAHGRESAQPPIFACGLCHYPNGKGRPENANVTGLSYEYIVQQLTDFKNGLRKTSDPRKLNTGLMAGFAKNMTDDEIKAAAKYFSAIPATPWIKVVESDTAPKTRPQGGHLHHHRGRRCRHGAAGPAHHRDARERGAHRVPARSALGLHRLRPAGQPQEGRGTGQDRCRQGHRLRRLPRTRPARLGPGADHWPVARRAISGGSSTTWPMATAPEPGAP